MKIQQIWDTFDSNIKERLNQRFRTFYLFETSIFGSRCLQFPEELCNLQYKATTYQAARIRCFNQFNFRIFQFNLIRCDLLQYFALIICTQEERYFERLKIYDDIPAQLFFIASLINPMQLVIILSNLSNLKSALAKFNYLFLNSKKTFLLLLQKWQLNLLYNYIQMFDNLKTLINKENLNNLKMNQRYISAEKSENHSLSSNQENSFDDQINDRIQVFNMLTISPNSSQEKYTVHKHYQSQQIKKLQKEISMLEEKIRIDQTVHGRQIQFLSEQHQIQLNTFKIKLDKCQHQIKRYSKNQSIVSSLKKDVKRFMELHEQDQKVIQKNIHELTLAKKQILQMKIIIKKKQEYEAQQQAIKYIEFSNETKLKEQLASIEKQRTIDNERKKQLQKFAQKLRNEKEDLERQLQALKLGFNHQVSLIEDKFKSHITKLQQDNQQLKRRNHIIQESFIDHLTQTSLNLQQNIRNIPQRSAKKNSSLYLQESPIRARSKDRERDDHNQSDEDPEKKENQSNKLKVQNKKLRSKLEKANEKIVELLRQKCVNQRKVQLK